jgi:deazaflavin-dependent oxidoreductase (nitroreductase family)
MSPSLSPHERRSQDEVNRLSLVTRRRIFTPMNLKDGSSVVAHLTTIGRKTGLPRTVELRFVYFRGCFYASSARVQGKHWCQNMLNNPSVEMRVKGEKLTCTARQVIDENLRREILILRDSAPRMERVVFEIKPRSGPA